MFKGTFGGILASALVHGAVAGSLYFAFFMWRPAPIVAELDLSMAPLISMPANAGGGYAKPSEAWTLPKKGKAPVPAPEPIAETKEEVQQEENQVPCTEPCAATGDGTGGGGTGEGEGQYIPAELAFRKPRWIKNFITSRDYPSLARQQHKDGRVVLSVLIDAQGRVRDARLLEGSFEVLNEVALRKIKDAIFSPAFNAQNVPVSCKVTLPIRFELR